MRNGGLAGCLEVTQAHECCSLVGPSAYLGALPSAPVGGELGLCFILAPAPWLKLVSSSKAWSIPVERIRGFQASEEEVGIRGV